MLESFFPKLSEFGYEVTSPDPDAYNRIAWAAGETERWWWPVLSWLFSPLRASEEASCAGSRKGGSRKGEPKRG
jgi:hypothetical protein